MTTHNRTCAQEQVPRILDTPVKELQRPHKLVGELSTTQAWLWALAHHRPVNVHGLLHFDLTACR